MFEELEIINKIQYYADQKNLKVKARNYEEAADFRKSEISNLLELCIFLKIDFSDIRGARLREKYLTYIDEYYRNKYGDVFEFPSTELIRQIKLDLILNEK